MSWFDLEDFKERVRFFGIFKAVYYSWCETPPVKLFNRLVNFIKQLYAYLPIIWRDNDFDYSALLNLMEFKLSRMSKHMIEHNIVVDAPKISKELRVAAELCKRINNDNYYELPLAKLAEQYGELEWGSEPTENTRSQRMILDRPKAREGTPEYDVVKKKERVIFERAKEQRDNDKKYLFHLMEKRMDSWWC